MCDLQQEWGVAIYRRRTNGADQYDLVYNPQKEPKGRNSHLAGTSQILPADANVGQL